MKYAFLQRLLSLRIFLQLFLSSEIPGRFSLINIVGMLMGEFPELDAPAMILCLRTERIRIAPVTFKRTGIIGDGYFSIHKIHHLFLGHFLPLYLFDLFDRLFVNAVKTIAFVFAFVGEV